MRPGTRQLGTRRSVALAVALGSLLLTACGSGTDAASTVDPMDFEEAAESAPREIASLYRSGDVLLSGGEEEYAARLAELRGLPVVVNNWASWCGPCREEFPFFQSQSVDRIDRVAFLGVVSEDSEDAAETFLRENPLPYPSVTDPEGELSNWTDQGLVGYPNTLFYNSAGKLVYVKQGPYVSEDDLASDVERYALRG